MTGKPQLEERRVLPRLQYGCDWDTHRFVIAVDEQTRKYLLWHPSCKCWQGLMNGYTRHPTILRLWTDTGEYNGGIDLHEGGWLSMGLIQRHAAAIDQFFGREVAQHITQVRQTLVVRRRTVR